MLPGELYTALVPLPDRSGTSKVSDVCSQRVSGKARQGAREGGFFVAALAEAIIGS